MPPGRNGIRELFSYAAVTQQQFRFPRDSHLLITTARFIYAWDSTGIHPIFKSSKGGIVAAHEAHDGSGMLAIADQHIVVLHDTKRGQESSWGLNADDDEVRQLCYTPDAKALFLATTLTNGIQRYSFNRARLLSPTQTHSSPPVALGVSPSGHLLLSASDDPPVIYLTSLTHRNAPVLIEPRASEAAVAVVAFHPERADVFLLAFRDGTLAAYDATRIVRQGQGLLADQEVINDGELSHLFGVHRPTSKVVTKDGIGVRATSITAAAFLPGYRLRAVSVGSDGRCRLVDFSGSGTVLRTWHAKAPLTSASVVSIETPSASLPRTVARHSITPAIRKTSQSNGTQTVIAVGRVDGSVCLFDSVGLLLARKLVSPDSQKIIGVEWVDGPAPRAIGMTIDTTTDCHDPPFLLPMVPDKVLLVDTKPGE